MTALISVIGPLTQAGLNPARDLGPRLFAYLAGWGRAALPDAHLGFLTIYVGGPLLGGLAAAAFHRVVSREVAQQPNATSEPPAQAPAAEDVSA